MASNELVLCISQSDLSRYIELPAPGETRLYMQDSDTLLQSLTPHLRWLRRSAVDPHVGQKIGNDTWVYWLFERIHGTAAARKRVNDQIDAMLAFAECYRQFATYNVFMSPSGRILHYTRNGGDGLLNNKQSIGIGGHVNSNDAVGDTVPRILREAARREIAEELRIANDPQPHRHCVGRKVSARSVEDTRYGLLLDNTNVVGRRHIGFVQFTYIDDDLLTAANIVPKDDSNIGALAVGCAPLVGDFEQWSAFLLQALSQHSELTAPALYIQQSPGDEVFRDGVSL